MRGRLAVVATATVLACCGGTASTGVDMGRSDRGVASDHPADLGLAADATASDLAFDAATARDVAVDVASDRAVGPGLDAGRDAAHDAFADAATGDAATGDAPTGDAPTGDAPTGDAPAVCPALTSHTVFVDGTIGASQAASANGSSICPFRTISDALAVTNGFTQQGTIRVKGGPAGGAPVVYSTATNGEVFPFAPTAPVIIQGDDQSSVSISGGGDCPAYGGANCTFGLLMAGVTVRGVTIENRNVNGMGIVIAGTLTTFTIEDSTLTNSAVGLMVQTDSFATVRHVTATGNGTAFLTYMFRSTLTMTNVVATLNTGGLRVFGGSASTDSCVFDQNTVGVSVSGATWSSNGDSVSNNRADGVENDQGTIQMTGSATQPCNVSGNGTAGTFNGFLLQDESTLVLSGCTVLGNSGNGVLVADRGSVNLGDGVASLGGNTLQSSDPTLRNQGAGVCNAVATVTADDNHWSQCPPTLATGLTACEGGVDIGNALSGTVSAAGCVSP